MAVNITTAVFWEDAGSRFLQNVTERLEVSVFWYLYLISCQVENNDPTNAILSPIHI
jgi:hypothetical protein